MGRVLDALGETGAADNTIVVFAGDNGLALGQHGLREAGPHEHSVRVPLPLRAPESPGAPASALCYLRTSTRPCAKPWVCPRPAWRDQRIAGNGGSAGARSRLLLAYRGYQRAVKDDRHKLISTPSTVAPPSSLTWWRIVGDAQPRHRPLRAQVVSALRRNSAAGRRADDDQAGFWELMTRPADELGVCADEGVDGPESR